MSEKYEIRLGDALKEAWSIFLKGPEVFVGLTFLYFAIIFALGHLPIVGQLITLAVSVFAIPAFVMVADASVGKERITFDSLQALVPHFPQLLALGLTKGVLISFGFMLLFFPGVYLVVIFAFAEFFVVLRGKNFVDSLKESKKLSDQNLLGVLGLVVFCGMLAFSGLLLVGLGVLVTAPLSILLLYCVFRRIDVRVVG